MAAVQQLLAAYPAPASLQSWRYWRIFAQTNNGNAGYIAIGEVELRGSIGGSDLTTITTPATSSSANGSFPATRIRDNNTTTQWQSQSGQTTNQWVRLDLASSQQVAQVAIYPYSSQLPSAPKDFIIQGSDDGTNFTDVKTFTDVTGWSAAWRTFDL